jgi:hypothetical protein
MQFENPRAAMEKAAKNMEATFVSVLYYFMGHKGYGTTANSNEQW